MIKRIFFGAVLVILVVLVAAALMKDKLAKSTLENWVADNTDFELDIEALSVNLFDSTIQVSKAQLLNPPDYPERHALDLTEFMIHYDLGSFFTDRLHFREIRLAIESVTIVQKANGEINIDRLAGEVQRATKAPADAPKAPAPQQPGGEEEKPVKEKPKKSFLIDTLTLAFGRGEYVVYREGQEEPRREVLELNRSETYRNVTDAKHLFRQITVQIALDQGLKNLGRLAKDHADRLGVKPEEVEKVTEAIGGFLDRLRK